MPASALVIGSMAPDFPFFLPFDPGIRTHTAAAIVTTDLLFGVPAWFLWHALLAAPALWAAPRPLRARLSGIPLGVRVRLRDVRAVLLTVAALAVGSATHVLWDEFTHARRWGPEHLPALDETWWLMPGYRWLQYLSSVVGLLVLLAWLVHWWRRTAARDGHRPGRALVALGARRRGRRRRRCAGRPHRGGLRWRRVRRHDLGRQRRAGRRDGPRGGLAPAAAAGQELRSSLNAWPQPPEVRP